MADDLVERLRGEIERRRDASGDMLHRGAPDTALTEAADAIESLRAENARLREALVTIRQRGIERDVKWAGMNAHDIARAALAHKDVNANIGGTDA